MPSASKILGDLVSSSGALSVTNTAITGTITTAQIADNAITTDKVAAGAIVTADIADGNVTGAKLANTAVTAGVYGGSSNSALITVDAQGRITAASNVAAAGGVTSLNGQTGAIDNTTQYAIGSYVYGRPANASTTYNNSTVAGSSLYAGSSQYGYISEHGNNWQPYYTGMGQGTTPSLVNTGSWRCVSISSGGIASGGGNYQATSGLWVRYA